LIKRIELADADRRTLGAISVPEDDLDFACASKIMSVRPSARGRNAARGVARRPSNKPNPAFA